VQSVQERWIIHERTGPMIFVGADGCKKGWCAVKLTDGVEWEVKVFKDIDALWK